MDLGELVTWLNDAVLFAPSMLLTERTIWSEIDADSFRLAFTDEHNTVSAQVFVHQDGSIHDFRTDDRWMTEPGAPPRRARWSTPIAGWHRVGVRMMPTFGKATWLLPEGPLTYAEFAFARELIEFNVDCSGR